MPNISVERLFDRKGTIGVVFEVLMMVNIKVMSFWGVSHVLDTFQRFGGTIFLALQFCTLRTSYPRKS